MFPITCQASKQRRDLLAAPNCRSSTAVTKGSTMRRSAWHVNATGAAIAFASESAASKTAAMTPGGMSANPARERLVTTMTMQVLDHPVAGLYELLSTIKLAFAHYNNVRLFLIP